MKKIGLIVFLMMFVVSVFSIDTALAAGKVFSLTKAEVKEKSSTTSVDKFSYKDETITSNVSFHKVGDYLTYNLVIKNVTDKTYTISEITDNNKSSNVVYEYNKNKGTKVKKGESITLLVKALYKKGESDVSKRVKNLSVKLTINYIDGAGKKGSSALFINPSTGDKIMLFGGMLLASLFIVLGILISKKRKLNKKVAAYLMILSLILPIGVSAASTIYSITFTSSYSLMDKVVVTVDIDGKKEKKIIDYNTKLSLEDPSIDGKKFIGWKTQDGKDFDISKPIKEDTSIKAEFIESVALLDNGSVVNLKMKALANDTTLDNVTNGGEDFVIEHIAKTKNLPSGYEKTDLKTISTSDSLEPVYIWWDENSMTLYWYTEAKKIMLNQDCSHLFEELEHLQELDFLKDIDSSKTTNMDLMFAFNGSNQDSSGLKYLDTSNVRSMHRMLIGMFSELNGISSWNVSKVKDMSEMLSNNSFTSTGMLSSWNVSSVENMSGLFAGNSSLSDLTGLSNWRTSSLLDMSEMFKNNSGITTLDGLQNFDTSKVTTMYDTFSWVYQLTDISAIANWNVSNVENMSGLFSVNPSLSDLTPISNWNMSSLTDARRMIYANPSAYGTITLRGNIAQYDSMFLATATSASSTGITVNYTASVAPIIDQIIATKSADSKIYKGVQVPN